MTECYLCGEPIEGKVSEIIPGSPMAEKLGVEEGDEELEEMEHPDFEGKAAKCHPRCYEEKGGDFNFS